MSGLAAIAGTAPPCIALGYILVYRLFVVQVVGDGRMDFFQAQSGVVLGHLFRTETVMVELDNMFYTDAVSLDADVF
jgi:hypothetical protein